MKKIFIKNPLVIFLTLTIMITSYISIYLFWGKKNILSCNFHLNMESPGKSSSLNINLYFFDDNTGFQSDFGSFTVDEKKHTIDRDIAFTYSGVDKYTYKIKFNKIKKRSLDNLPDKVLPDYAAGSVERYFSFTRIKEDIILINERGKPFIMCIKNK